MEVLIRIGGAGLLYCLFSVLFLRNKRNLERRLYLWVVLYFVVLGILSVYIIRDFTNPEQYINLGIAAVVAFGMFVINGKIAGFQLEIYKPMEEVIEAMKPVFVEFEMRKKDNDLKERYFNNQREVIVFEKRASYVMVLMRFRGLSPYRKHKRVVEQLVEIDPRNSFVKEMKWLSIVSVLFIIVGIIL